MTEGSSPGKPWPLVLLLIALAVSILVPVILCDAPQDDSYISYVYARNMARGAGLVYNAGEPPVEGYTNFLWTAGLGLAMRAGLDPEWLAPALGLLCTALTVGLTFVLARRLGSSPWFAALAALVFATRPTLMVHAAGGLETALFGLLVLLGLLPRLTRGRSRRSDWASSLALALAALTRPEGVLVYGLLEIADLVRALWARTSLGSAVGQALMRALPFVVLVGAHVAWRRATYGDWVPNTFHAKVAEGLSTWIGGARYVGKGLLYFGVPFLVVPWFLPRLASAEWARRGEWGTCVFVSVAYALYVVSVGGDYIAMHRFLWPLFPIWAALAATAASELARRAHAAGRRRAGRLVTAGFLALLAGQTAYEALDNPNWREQGLRHQQLVAAGRTLHRILPEDAWIAVTAAGRVPYFADRRTLDMMGLSDAHIARQPADVQGMILAGHLKGDGHYVLDCAPDVILFLHLMVLDRALAGDANWKEVARHRAFGVSERQIVADPRFHREYGLFSLKLPGVRGYLNMFARPEVFAQDPPPGLRRADG